MAPTAAESRVRASMIDLIANSITNQWPDAEVLPFGSWQTGLYLPTGDIDLVVTTPRMEDRTKVRLLRDLAALMRRARITADVAVISKAKVPIIKFVTNDGELELPRKTSTKLSQEGLMSTFRSTTPIRYRMVYSLLRSCSIIWTTFPVPAN
jgi:DNA polymerase sigma